MELENKNNNILDDLDLRNRNWNNIQHRLDVLDGYILKDIDSFEDVQRIVRMGLADKVFTVGDQFTATYNGIPYVWEVIGINHDKPSDPKYKHSLTIQAHECLLNAQFSAPQALYTVQETPMAPGDYYFTHGGVSYQFALGQEVPVKGQLTFPWSYGTDILTTKISTYSNNESTTAIETVGISIGAAGTELVGINDINRCRYGSDNYEESAIRQFLNSNETTFKWKSKTEFDRISVGVPYSGSGFLKLLDQDLVNVIGKVDKQVARNTVTDGGGQDVFSDKVFLLSKKEVYGGDEGTVTGENPYEYYAVMSSAPTVDAVDWRIKYLSESPRYWWLRSPRVGYSSSSRIVHTTGNVNYNFAINALGTAPACVII